MKPLVLVRGGGDIASGIIYRLHRAGFPVVVNEIAIPTMIRRKVAYGNAVHVGEMNLERITSCFVSLQEVPMILGEGRIPVVTEPYEKVCESLQPTIIIDSILAKRNLGTQKADAPLVIGVGPGFTAGEDVHVVIETMRGHSLGRCIYDGPAIANTGIPGNVGGYTKERVLHAPCEGMFTAKRHIGEEVQQGEIIGMVDAIPIRAQINGVLRGVLKSGLIVPEHCKLADIDARAKRAHCFSISDKALSVGGGAMEAVMAWMKEEGKGND